jgi:hypothetical protein
MGWRSYWPHAAIVSGADHDAENRTATPDGTERDEGGSMIDRLLLLALGWLAVYAERRP